MDHTRVGGTVVLEREQFDTLFDVLRKRGYRLVGPTVRDGAVIYDPVACARDLPVGWTEEQDGGSYRLKRRDDEALFGYSLGPQSWKRFLHLPIVRLWTAEREGSGFTVIPEKQEAPKLAFIGVRSCELHAIRIQDRVLMDGECADPIYKARREGLFIVAVDCGKAGGTCFCVSMGTGPRATAGYDLRLTEILETGRHFFVIDIGTERGADVLDDVRVRAAGDAERGDAAAISQKAALQMGRMLDTRDIRDLLYRNMENPRWDDAARRCLACGNCTMVCPTCFCTTVEDATDLSGLRAERNRRWDSCFTMDFSYLHGGSVRVSIKSRYRQWLTHKLASWIDQFGASGCVGCGRCITWCPVAIDITEEVRAIRESERAAVAPVSKENSDANA